MSENIHLLTADERTKLNRLAIGEDLFARRAQALLSLESGISQAQAGQKAGLTRDQVRYILTKFRQQRLNAFPTDLILQEPVEMLEEVPRGDETHMKSPDKPERIPLEDKEVDKSALVKKSSARKKVKKVKPKKKGTKKLTKKEKKSRMKNAKKGKKKKPGKKKSQGGISSHKRGKSKKKATKKRKNK